ncbi:hypothetical protein RAC89_25000 [Paenibacillus sp. GD4]|uniref:hypothetical protein n=1 Tax=Paenibacillus sp. GD4 TaxID=3068890 RepID=UPI002796E0B4|nr:hypothetical protein [Paenibacillus sp. GD4]MDQ1913664.1 hypothetical protein [Paenibacillus sp. GD4]
MSLTVITLWAALLVPWLTLFFLKKEVVKKYFPVATFTALLVTIVFEIAYSLNWWEMLVSIAPGGEITNISFVYGVFFIGTIWIFYFTYRKFWIFLITNVIIGAMQSFVLSPYLFEGWLFRLNRLNDFQVFLIMVGLSLIIYVYQRWQEGALKDVGRNGYNKVEFDLRNPLSAKEKSR